MAENIHGFAQACLQFYKDKFVEINTGEKKTKLKLSDFEYELKNIIRGTVRGACGDGIIVDCNVDGKVKSVLINVWSIISISEIDGIGIESIYCDESFRSNRRA